MLERGASPNMVISPGCSLVALIMKSTALSSLTLRRGRSGFWVRYSNKAPPKPSRPQKYSDNSAPFFQGSSPLNIGIWLALHVFKVNYAFNRTCSNVAFPATVVIPNIPIPCSLARYKARMMACASSPPGSQSIITFFAYDNNFVLFPPFNIYYSNF